MLCRTLLLLLQVRATLNGKDLVVTPAINDIYKYLTRAVKNVVESAKMFTRWMHGTCRPAPPQVNHNIRSNM
jgi:dynein heavy chain, axonemal